MLRLLEPLVPERNCLKSRKDGDFLIVTSPSLDIFYLNAVAKDFYLALNRNKTLAEIRDEFLEQYDVGLKALSTDLAHLVRDMQWKNIISLKELKNSR